MPAMYCDESQGFKYEMRPRVLGMSEIWFLTQRERKKKVQKGHRYANSYNAM